MDVSNDSNTKTIKLPKLPKNIISEFGYTLKASIDHQIVSLVETAIACDKSRDDSFKQTRALFTNTNRIAFGIRTGFFDNMDSYINENECIIRQLISATNSAAVSSRDNRISSAIERFAEMKLMYTFLSKGIIMNSTALNICNDDEYIGATLGFAQELSRYAVGRAGEGDADSVQMCKAVVTELNGKLLEFNFRNGHLRRKYDSLKYSLRNLENILCELSFMNVNPSEFDHHDQDTKRPRIESVSATEATATTAVVESTFLDLADIECIRVRMEKQDSVREEVIKISRDVQKLSKQAIYSTQKGGSAGYDEADKKLASAQQHLINIQKLILPYPSLRQGAVSSCIEEWVEGKLFLQFSRDKTVAVMSALLPVDVDSNEYIGGLSDFTGEMGRVAVSRAAKRDISAAAEILQVMLIISSAISEVNIGGKYTKKNDAVSTNLRKVEDLLYELSLQKLGGRAVNSLREREQVISSEGGKNDGNEEES